jgi:hypothetical protein
VITLGDTAPLLVAANLADRADGLARTLVTALGRDVIVLDTMLVEVDHLLRSPVGSRTRGCSFKRPRRVSTPRHI